MADEPADDNEPLTAAEVRDAALIYIGQHELKCTTTGVPGTPCWGERCNLIAFLCHALGVRGEHIPFMLKSLAKYDHDCAGCKSHHGPINPN